MINYKYLFIDLQLQLTGDLANVRYYAERKQASNTYRATIQMCKHLSEMILECNKTKQSIEFTQGVLNQNTSDLLKILTDTNMYNVICDYYKIYKGVK